LLILKSVRARDTFVQELGRVRREFGFKLIGYVVMPKHVHLLIGENIERDAVGRAASIEVASGGVADFEGNEAFPFGFIWLAQLEQRRLVD